MDACVTAAPSAAPDEHESASDDRELNLRELTIAESQIGARHQRLLKPHPLE